MDLKEITSCVSVRFENCDKKCRKKLCMSGKSGIFAPLFKNSGLWCNGNTTDSGPVIPGSNPGSPTKKAANVISS